MGNISDVAMDIEELFYVENKSVFEIAEIVNFPVDDIRTYLATLEQDTLDEIDDFEEDFDIISGYEQDSYGDFN